MQTSALPHVVIDIPAAHSPDATERSTELQPVATPVRSTASLRSSARAAFQTNILKKRGCADVAMAITFIGIPAAALAGSVVLLVDGVRRDTAVPDSIARPYGEEGCIGEGCGQREIASIELVFGGLLTLGSVLFTVAGVSAVCSKS